MNFKLWRRHKEATPWHRVYPTHPFHHWISMSFPSTCFLCIPVLPWRNLFSRFAMAVPSRESHEDLCSLPWNTRVWHSECRHSSFSQIKIFLIEWWNSWWWQKFWHQTKFTKPNLRNSSHQGEIFCSSCLRAFPNWDPNFGSDACKKPSFLAIKAGHM